MSDFKGVKLAWANGETVQFNCGYMWNDWCDQETLHLRWHREWRVKPKTKKVTQYEYKVFRGGIVSTMSHSSFKEAEESLAYMLNEMDSTLVEAVGTNFYEVTA